MGSLAFAAEVDDQTYTAGTAIDALMLPAASGGTGTLTYSLVGLPAGLSFDAATRMLFGHAYGRHRRRGFSHLHSG